MSVNYSETQKPKGGLFRNWANMPERAGIVWGIATLNPFLVVSSALSLEISNRVFDYLHGLGRKLTGRGSAPERIPMAT